ncbi:hypothetical protein EN781_00005 [Mesorhizobium sp. M4A.F.Ca.ET.090.04.2.1]|uniref:hypothetical protein n=1 Tax=Mesorhizobium sp. M4A.F.Ca.ET.090.04.2.1 TaxID=2496663 RepID=UPI000FCB421A|nr:hypothetical protein [Mesorhizobium sp. M4A.F.Ca.ET.090.04.2.1]RVC47555.1 hypothetical protein EN781_00005 [Mesorhizobium sp. M4A.F.Ca.ET.090.04.2.1]
MTTDREMPRYQCHKIVHALKIATFVINEENGAMLVAPADEGYAPFEVTRDWERRFKPIDDDLGYYVVYDGGYASWSPSKAFEEGYTRL